jgi:diguanylate cyclase (GGDEF)-like protein
MALLYIFVVGSSLALLFTVLFYALRNLDIPGSKAYALQIVFVTIWSIGSLLEMVSATEQAMLFWRNFEQIGVFLLPVACVYFAIDYAGYDKLKKFLPLLLIIPIAAIILIFTDSYTHLMRTGYTVTYNKLFGNAVSVDQTPLGVMFVAYNYVLVFIALVTLFVFSRQIAKSQRGQVLLVLFATALVFILAFFKTAFLEGTQINLPIVTIYLPGSLILFYNLYRNKFFQLTPIAREKVFDVIEVGIIVTHNKGVVTDMNPYARKILLSCMGLTQSPVGADVRNLFPAYPEWVRIMQSCTSGTLELVIGTEEPCYIEVRVFPLQSNSGRPIGAVTLLRDMTQLRIQEFALRTRAETDFLTSLMNRDSFLKEFDHLLREHDAAGKPLSVLMMDLDKFKIINDTYGHDTGDRVLKAVANVLKATLRQNDAIARIGGDEFAAVLPNVDKSGAAEIADRIIQAASEQLVIIDPQMSIPLRLSIGICDNSELRSADDMLKQADKGMYIAKGKPEKHHAC